MSNLTKKLLAGTILSACAFSANAYTETVGATEDSIMRGLRGGLKAIALPIDVAIERAEDLYTYNGGAALTSNQTNTKFYLDLLTDTAEVATTTDNYNDYLQNLNICENYWIQVQIKDARFDSDNVMEADGYTEEVPLPKEFLGKTMYFVPVYAATNYKITNWECITDFNMLKSIFKGDSRRGTKMWDNSTVATRSVLAKYTDHPVIEKCMYMETAQWDLAKANAATNVTDAGKCGAVAQG